MKQNRLQGFAVLLALLFPFTCALLFAVAGLLSDDVRRAVGLAATVLPYLASVISAAVSVAVLAGTFYLAGLAATDIAHRWHSRHHVYPNERGVFPLVRNIHNWFDATPDSVKAVAAWTEAQAANGIRPTATATRAALYAPPTRPILPAPTPTPTPTRTIVPSLSDIDIDPAVTPHVLIVAKSGFGKTSFVRYLLARFAERYPSEITICDPDGINWLDQTSASTTAEIASAIDATYSEFARRQSLLKAGESTSWPYRVLLVEETETVFERLGQVDKATRANAQFQLREIARLGRKAGVFLWAVTQVAAGDIFDLHVRRNMTVFCGHSERGVGQMLGIPKTVDLTALRPGQMFASTTGQVFSFPANSDTTRFPLVSNSNHIARGRQPTPDQAAQMRSMSAAGRTMTDICFAFYDYKDKVVFDFVRLALQGKL